MRWIWDVLTSFRASSLVTIEPGFAGVRQALRRLAAVATLVASSAQAMLYALSFALAGSNREVPSFLWQFFPRGWAYRLFYLFTPVVFALLVWVCARVMKRPGRDGMSAGQSLQIALLTTAAIAFAMLLLTFTPYFAAIAYAAKAGLGPRIDAILPWLTIYTTAVSAALFVLYWLTTSRLVSRSGGTAYPTALATVLVCGLVTFGLAHVLDPIVHGWVQSRSR